MCARIIKSCTHYVFSDGLVKVIAVPLEYIICIILYSSVCEDRQRKSYEKIVRCCMCACIDVFVWFLRENKTFYSHTKVPYTARQYFV